MESETHLEAAFAQGQLDLETYWRQVAQPRFAALAVPLTGKDVKRLQKGLARVAQGHAAAQQYDRPAGEPQVSPMNEDARRQAERVLRRTLGYINADE